ncbi:uncharacterized protein LOC143523109 [Brachyhypopomus gauderio]|uniref:uncharacterized protein LOC143523109 n=1 Tax=Brachyhypopomus gauderio TaxID=698409 RepID=UPI004040F49D
MFSRWFNRETSKNLRERIEKLGASVKLVLQDADIADTQLLTLTREDLNELFPGNRNFQLRRRMMELISEAVQHSMAPEQTSTSLDTLRGLIQRPDRGEPAAEGIWKEHLHTLRDLEKELTLALDFIKSHIELMENLTETPMNEAASSLETTVNHIHADREPHLPAASQSTPLSLPVKIHSVVCGNTLGAHDAILKHVHTAVHSSAEDCNVILLFCPIVSREGTDIEAAIQKVPVSKATILVVMHHTFHQDHAGVTPRIWSSKPNIVKCVNVMFHESEPGLLLGCHANTQAIAQIQSALQQFR